MLSPYNLSVSLLLVVLLWDVTPSTAFAGVIPFRSASSKLDTSSSSPSIHILRSQADASGDSIATTSPAPNLDGKRILPFKILMAGVKDHRVPAVYAVLNANYKRGSSPTGWEACEYVGVTQDLAHSLQGHFDKHGKDQVAHVRPLTFASPDPLAMQQVAKDWRLLADQAGSALKTWDADVMEYLYDDDDDEDDEDECDDEEQDEAEELRRRLAEAEGMVYIGKKDTAPATPIVSPFGAASVEQGGATGDTNMQFTAENVDKVLNEVRPYLIADGGNVKVERVDAAEKNVYLKLEGACGSCESSTVTMQMGIERTLRENFADLNQVIRVDSDAYKPTELTRKVVDEEVSRLKPAIVAMGGQCDVVNVDTVTGTVDIRFRGGSKVRQGLELALLDIPLLNKVNFLMGDE